MRPETATDAPGIAALVQQAFEGHPHSAGTEAAIVDSLRFAGALALSLVAEHRGALVGHVAFSPVTIDGRDGAWFGLGPLAVRRDVQRAGIGGRLVREGLAQLRQQGAAGCVLLGDAAYYARFGFAAHPGLVYPGPPPEHFVALAFAGTPPTGVVAYHPAFT